MFKPLSDRNRDLDNRMPTGETSQEIESNKKVSRIGSYVIGAAAAGLLAISARAFLQGRKAVALYAFVGGLAGYAFRVVVLERGFMLRNVSQTTPTQQGGVQLTQPPKQEPRPKPLNLHRHTEAELRGIFYPTIVQGYP